MLIQLGNYYVNMHLEYNASLMATSIQVTI